MRENVHLYTVNSENLHIHITKSNLDKNGSLILDLLRISKYKIFLLAGNWVLLHYIIVELNSVT